MDLTIFNYNQNKVRTVLINGEPWFVLKDVCDILGIGNSRMVADRLDDDEKNTVSLTDGNR
jgi:prophage antirepressor-like protein